MPRLMLLLLHYIALLEPCHLVTEQQEHFSNILKYGNFLALFYKCLIHLQTFC